MAAQIPRTEAAEQPCNTKRSRLLALLNKIEALEAKIKNVEVMQSEPRRIRAD